MRPGDIAIDLRSRNPWEAIDLGAAMYRSWFKPLVVTWLVVYVPVLCACAAAFWERLWLAWVVLWWLKPLFERFVLHVASRSAFGACPTVRQTLASWREILAPLPWLWITIGRPFFLQRGYTMPVSQLERQRGAQRRARERLLGRRTMASGTWLAVICAHFELTVAASLYVLAGLLQTSQASTSTVAEFMQHLFANARNAFDFTDLLIQAAAMSLVGPFFICSGFALYLNRRTQLEAWDIEVSLRRIEERVAPLVRALPALAFAAVLCGLLPTTPAHADDAAARAAIQKVLAEPEFQTTRTQKHLQPRTKSEEARPASWNWGQLAALFSFLAESARALLWLIAVAGAVLLIALAARRSPPPLTRPGRRYVPPDAVLGLSITPDSLPANVAAAARELFLRGEARLALALLYRGALSAIVHRHHVELAPGSTEDEVLRAARAALAQGPAEYFTELVRGWSSAAYAGRPPEAAAGQRLCDEWPRHFAGQAGT